MFYDGQEFSGVRFISRLEGSDYKADCGVVVSVMAGCKATIKSGDIIIISGTAVGVGK